MNADEAFRKEDPTRRANDFSISLYRFCVAKAITPDYCDSDYSTIRNARLSNFTMGFPKPSHHLILKTTLYDSIV